MPGQPAPTTVDAPHPATLQDGVASGKSTYNSSCARCHGFQMVNPAPGVFDLRTFPTEERDRFIASVSHGKNAMPAWQGLLSAAEIESLWCYVMSLHTTGP